MKYGSRKFIITLFILIATTALAAYGKIDSGGVVILFGLGGSGYGLFNYLDKKGDQNDRVN